MELLLATLLSFVSGVLVCVMLAGSSDDCINISNAPWGTISLTTDSGLFVHMNLGLTHYCEEAIVSIIEESSGKSYIDSEHAMGCSEAGFVAMGLGIVMLVCSVTSVLVIGLRAMKGTSLKLQRIGLMSSVTAVISGICALIYFDVECLRVFDYSCQDAADRHFADDLFNDGIFVDFDDRISTHDDTLSPDNDDVDDDDYLGDVLFFKKPAAGCEKSVNASVGILSGSFAVCLIMISIGLQVKAKALSPPSISNRQPLKKKKKKMGKTR